MNKYLATAMFGLLLIPSLTFAATADEINAQLVLSLKSVIALLVQEVSMLSAQLAVLNSIPTTPPTVQPPQTFGSISPVSPTQPVDNSPIPSPQNTVHSIPVDNSQIVINNVRQLPANPAALQPFGAVNFFVSVQDTNGNNEKGVDVVMAAPDNIYGDSVTAPTNQTPGLHPPESEQWYANLFYVPTTGGTKTVTFTYGNLTKTHDITF